MNACVFAAGLALSALIQPRTDLGKNSSHSGMGFSTIVSLIKGGGEPLEDIH